MLAASLPPHPCRVHGCPPSWRNPDILMAEAPPPQPPLAGSGVQGGCTTVTALPVRPVLSGSDDSPQARFHAPANARVAADAYTRGGVCPCSPKRARACRPATTPPSAAAIRMVCGNGGGGQCSVGSLARHSKLTAGSSAMAAQAACFRTGSQLKQCCCASEPGGFRREPEPRRAQHRQAAKQSPRQWRRSLRP